MKHLLVRCDDQHLLTLYYTSIPQISHEIKCFIFYEIMNNIYQNLMRRILQGFLWSERHGQWQRLGPMGM